MPHHYDTLGVVVISSPDMFELLFRPYLLKHHTQQQHDPGEASDPLDRCMKLQFDQMKALCASHDVYSLQDFELLPTRRPKILVQTAGHVAGAAYYYQLSDVENPPWEGKKKIYGVSIHPLYGGWFALRGVLVFRDIQVAELSRKQPPDCVRSESRRVELLEEFNFHWQEWRYRDIMDQPVKQRYSEDQQKYFGTKPALRRELVAEWIALEQCSGAF